MYDLLPQLAVIVLVGKVGVSLKSHCDPHHLLAEKKIMNMYVLGAYSMSFFYFSPLSACAILYDEGTINAPEEILGTRGMTHVQYKR